MGSISQLCATDPLCWIRPLQARSAFFVGQIQPVGFRLLIPELEDKSRNERENVETYYT